MVGRLASIIAMRPAGPAYPAYTPPVDCGDKVIVVNAEKVVLTGRKPTEGPHHHTASRRPQVRKAKFICRPVPSACSRKLSKRCSTRVRCRAGVPQLLGYKGPEHAAQAQTPVSLDAAMNSKNKRIA